MKFSKILICCLLCSSFFNLYSQDTLKLKKGLFNTTDGQQLKFSSLQQNGSEFLYTTPGSGISKSINQKDILSVSKKDGDNTILFGVIMGASGCLGAIIGAGLGESNANSQGMVVDKSAKRTTIVVFTGVSVLAGAIWGAATPKYKKVYENPDYATRFIDHLNFSVNIGKEPQLCIQYKF